MKILNLRSPKIRKFCRLLLQHFLLTLSRNCQSIEGLTANAPIEQTLQLTGEWCVGNITDWSAGRE